MISIPKLKSTEWYIDEIKSLFVRSDALPKNREKCYLKKREKYDRELTVSGLGIGLSLDEFLVADYSTLLGIKSKIDNGEIVLSDYPQLCSLEKEYEKFSGKNINLRIVKELNINTCPYCNRDYINNRGRNHASAQMDHYFNKDTYPIFAICLYNLIPSCYACNHIKSNKPTEEVPISPYNHEYNMDRAFRFTYIPKSMNFLEDENEIEIDFNYLEDKRIKKNIKALKIKEAYEINNDYVFEILKKAKIYTKSQLKEYMGKYHDLFSSEEEMIRVLFGNYIKDEDLNKRPLAKLTKDILKELKIYE